MACRQRAAGVIVRERGVTCIFCAFLNFVEPPMPASQSSPSLSLPSPTRPHVLPPKWAAASQPASHLPPPPPPSPSLLPPPHTCRPPLQWDATVGLLAVSDLSGARERLVAELGLYSRRNGVLVVVVFDAMGNGSSSGEDLGVCVGGGRTRQSFAGMDM